RDLIVASPGIIDIYAGRAEGGYDLTPTTRIALQRLGGVPPVVSDIDVIDVDGDGRNDLVITCLPNRPNNPRGTIQVALNATAVDQLNRPVEIAFAPPTAYDVGNSPVSTIVGNFDADPNGRLDVITIDQALNGTSWELSFLPGTGGGNFGAETRFQIGTTNPPNPNLTLITSPPTDIVAIRSSTPSNRNHGTLAFPSSSMIISAFGQFLWLENISFTTPGTLSLRRPLVGPNNSEDGLFGTGANSIEMDGTDLIAADSSSIKD